MFKVVVLLLLPLMAVAQTGLKQMVETAFPTVKDYGDRVVKSAYPALESLGKKALPTLQNVARSPEGTQLLLTALPVVQGLAERSGLGEELNKALPEVQKFLGLPTTLEDFLTQRDNGGYAIGKTDPPKSNTDARNAADYNRGSRYTPGPATSRGGGYGGSGDSYGGGGYTSGPDIVNNGYEGNGDRFGYRPPPYVPPFGRFQNTESSLSGTPVNFGSFGNFGDSFGFGQDQNLYGKFADFGDRFRGYDSSADTYATPTRDNRRSYVASGAPYNDRPYSSNAGPPRYDRPDGYGGGVPIYGGYPGTNAGYSDTYAGNPGLVGQARPYDRPNDRYTGNANVNTGNLYGSQDGYGRYPVRYNGNPSGNSGGYSAGAGSYGGNSGGYGGIADGYRGNPVSNSNQQPVNAGAYPIDTSNYRGNPASNPVSNPANNPNNQKGYGLNLADFALQTAQKRVGPSSQGGYPFNLGTAGGNPPSPQYKAPQTGASSGFSANTPDYGTPSSGYNGGSTNPLGYPGGQASTAPYGSPGPRDERLSNFGTHVRQDTGIDSLQSKGGYGTKDTHTYGNDKIITTGKVTQTDEKTGFSDVFRGQGILSTPASFGGRSGNAEYLFPPLPPSPVDKTGLAGVYDRMAAQSPGVQSQTTDAPFVFTPSSQLEQDTISVPGATYPVRSPGPVVPPAAFVPSPPNTIIDQPPVTTATNTFPTTADTYPYPTTDDVATVIPTTRDSVSKPDSGGLTQRAPDSNADFGDILRQLDPNADINRLLQQATANGTNTDLGSLAKKASESGIDVNGIIQQLGPNATIGSVLQKASEGGRTSNIGSILQGAAESGALGNIPTILQRAPESGPTANIGSILQGASGGSTTPDHPATTSPSPTVDIGALVKVAAENGVDVKAIQDQLSNNPDLGSVVQRVSEQGIDVRALQEQLGNNPRVADALKKAAASGFDIGALLGKLGSGGPSNLAGLQRLLLNKPSS